MGYFEENCERNNDKLSLYNLAHIYLYEDKNDKRIEKSIQLLIKSLQQSFKPAVNLLCIALIRKNNFEYESIQKELIKKVRTSSEIYSMVLRKINLQKLTEKPAFDMFSEDNKSIDYLYNYVGCFMISKDLFKEDKQSKTDDTHEYLTDDFYQGFGKDIL